MSFIAYSRILGPSPFRHFDDREREIYKELLVGWSGPTIKQIYAKRHIQVSGKKMRKWLKHVLTKGLVMERQYRLLGMELQANQMELLLKGAQTELSYYAVTPDQGGLIRRYQKT